MRLEGGQKKLNTMLTKMIFMFCSRFLAVRNTWVTSQLLGSLLSYQTFLLVLGLS